MPVLFLLLALVVTLKSGWNAVAFPFSRLTSLQGDGLAVEWRDGGYQPVALDATLDPTHGYYVYSREGGELRVEGVSEPAPVALRTGWNLVAGSPGRFLPRTLVGEQPTQSGRASWVYAQKPTTLFEQPVGTYASAGATDPQVVGHPQVRGVLMRVRWSELEPSPGAFDFTPLDRQLTLVRQAGKGWSLAVIGGPSSPAWLTAERLSITFRGQATSVPKFWDPTLQSRLQALAQALGARYGSDPLLGLVYVPQMSANGIEGHFNGNSPSTLTSQGFTAERWSSAALQACAAFAAAFPTKPLALELHELQGAEDLLLAGLPDQVGGAVWWLSGRPDYQPALLQKLKDFRGPLYAQLIDRADNLADYSAAFTQARQLGVRYVEPWEVDFLSNRWNDLFANW